MPGLPVSIFYSLFPLPFASFGGGWRRVRSIELFQLGRFSVGVSHYCVSIDPRVPSLVGIGDALGRLIFFVFVTVKAGSSVLSREHVQSREVA